MLNIITAPGMCLECLRLDPADCVARTPDRNVCMISRDHGVGNGTAPQLASDNNRMLENTPVVLNNADTDKVK